MFTDRFKTITTFFQENPDMAATAVLFALLLVCLILAMSATSRLNERYGDLSRYVATLEAERESLRQSWRDSTLRVNSLTKEVGELRRSNMILRNVLTSNNDRIRKQSGIIGTQKSEIGKLRSKVNPKQ